MEYAISYSISRFFYDRNVHSLLEHRNFSVTKENWLKNSVPAKSQPRLVVGTARKFRNHRTKRK